MLSNKPALAPENAALPKNENINPVRLYEGMREMPLAERMVGRLKLVFNKIWSRRHEKKAVGLKKNLDKFDAEIAALEQSKKEIEKSIEFFRRENMPGIESFQLGLKEKDQQIRELLNKRDRIQSRFEIEENEVKIFSNKRDLIANRFISNYDSKLGPMESELESLRGRLRVLREAHEKKQAEQAKKIEKLEEQRKNLGDALLAAGSSEGKIKRSATMKNLSKWIKESQREIAKDRLDLEKKTQDMNSRIAKLERKSNPYRDKREKFIRIKQNRPLDMGVETRKRGTDPGMEEIRVGIREFRKDDSKEKKEKDGKDKIKEDKAKKEEEGAEKKEEEMKKKADGTKTGDDEAKKREDVKEKNKEEEKYGATRAAAWHTIYQLLNSPDFKLEDLNTKNVQEGDKKFIELTRKLWDKLVVHENPDQDANACLKIMELAGFDVSKFKTHPPNKMIESGVAMDFGGRHGVVAEEEGKRVIFDHHNEKSDRTTSASRFVYETLVEMGMLKREEYLDKFIEFTTVCDNMRFTPEEMKKVYSNYSKNLYGLGHRMKTEDILELFKEKVDPMADLPEDYLTSHTYYKNPRTREEEALLVLKDGKNPGDPKIRSGLVGTIEYMIKKGKGDLDRMERVKKGEERTPENIKKNEFVLDTGEERFGKILINLKKHTGKNKYEDNISGVNKSEQLEIFSRGYGGYLSWSPEENGFVLFTQKKMDETTLPGGFSQGFNVRGHMWMKPKPKDGDSEDSKKLTVTLEEIFSKLAGKKDFHMEKKLEILISVDRNAKEILKLMYDKSLTEEEIGKIVKKAGSRRYGEIIRSISSQIKMKDKNKKLGEIFKEKMEALPADKKDEPSEVERIFIETLLEYQKDNV